MHPGCNFTLNYRSHSSTERNYKKKKSSFSMDLVFGSGHCSDAVAALQPRLAERTWKVEPARDKINVSVLSGQGNLVWGGECHRCVGRRTWPSLAHHTGLSPAMDQINCGFFCPPRTENPPFSTLNPPKVSLQSPAQSRALPFGYLCPEPGEHPLGHQCQPQTLW